jgi:4-carboxymuconolactone decarboxylase
VSDPRHDAGMRIRREVLGDEHVDHAVAGTTAFTEPFQDFITRYAWGDVWARDGLDRRTRSAITLAVLTALGSDREIAMHVRAAVRNGLSPRWSGAWWVIRALSVPAPASPWRMSPVKPGSRGRRRDAFC